jgi:TolB-like protein
MRTLFLTLIVSGLPGMAVAAEQEVIAVLPFKAHAMRAGQATMFSATLATMLAEKGHFKVVDRAHMDKVMAEQSFKLMAATEDQLMDLGKFLHADYLVVGDLGRLGSRWSLSVRLISVASGGVTKTKRMSWSDADMVEQLLDNLASELSGLEGGGNVLDPRFGLSVWHGLNHHVCRVRAKTSGRVTGNLAGTVSFNLGTAHGLTEGMTLSVEGGGGPVGEIEVATVSRRGGTGTFVATSMGTVAARKGMRVVPNALRLGVASFEVQGASGVDGVAAAKQVVKHLRGQTVGCMSKKRSPIKSWAKMSPRRRSRLAKKLDGVITGTILTRRGRMVAEVQVVDPADGAVLAQFSAAMK